MEQEIPEVHIGTTLLACLAGSLMGWGFVGLATRRFLTDPRLPAPEAVACDQLIQTAVQNPGRASSCQHVAIASLARRIFGTRRDVFALDTRTGRCW